jgi:hypothetical protein
MGPERFHSATAVMCLVANIRHWLKQVGVGGARHGASGRHCATEFGAGFYRCMICEFILGYLMKVFSRIIVRCF